jgi:hypothetical protein
MHTCADQNFVVGGNYPGADISILLEPLLSALSSILRICTNQNSPLLSYIHIYKDIQPDLIFRRH